MKRNSSIRIIASLLLLVGMASTATAQCYVNSLKLCHVGETKDCTIWCQSYDGYPGGGTSIKYVLTCSSTDGQNGLVCAAAAAGLDYCEEDSIPDRCTWTEQYSECVPVYSGTMILKYVGEVKDRPKTDSLPYVISGGTCPQG